MIHLHGELLKACSSVNTEYVIDCKRDINLGDTCPDGYQLRPFIVWFGEEVPELATAIKVVEQADIVVIVGTSMQVYPAASLVNYAKLNTPVYYVDPVPEVNTSLTTCDNLTVIAGTAANALPAFVNKLLAKHIN